MKKINILGLTIWLISLFLLNVSAVSATTNCKVDCCDNSLNGFDNTCIQPTSQICAKDAAYTIAGTLLTDCGLSPTGTSGCNANQLPVCCCTYPPPPKHEQASKPSLISNEALTPLQFTPQVSIPNSDFQAGAPINVGTPSSTASGTIMRSDLLGRYILSLYNYGLAIVGILAAIILMAGGLLWLTSGGSAAKIGQAKELMTGSIIGLVILVGAWMILNTINPNLTQLPSINTLIINEVPYCCDSVKGNVLAVKGECPDSSKGCTNGEICADAGNNQFGCIDKSKFICCEYKKKDILSCKSVKTSCPAAPTGYVHVKDYPNTYCGNKEILADNCLAAECSNSSNGDKCPGLSKSQTDPSGIQPYYCYNKMCWKGPGKKGDHCGKKDGSTCLETCPQGYNWAYLTLGQNCEKPLNCCQPN